MDKKFYKIMKEWVGKNYGSQEMDDPCYNLKELAKELDKHFHEMYWQQELEYIKEDVENYAEKNMADIKLTEKQMYAVADEIRSSDWYGSINPEDIEFYIREELRKGSDNV